MEEMNIAEEVVINTSSVENFCTSIVEMPQNFAEKLKNMTSFTFMEIFTDEKTAIDICCEIGLLPKRTNERNILCPKCGGITRAHTNKDNRLKFTYRCCKRVKYEKYFESGKNIKCYGYISPLYNTFFESISVSTLQVLRLIYCWVIKTPVTSAVLEAQVSNKTGIDFYCLFREIAEIIVSNSEYQIGGTGLHVEVDEKCIWKRKYHRGRITKADQITIFGIYCKETKQGIFWHVEDDNRRVLWSQLLKYIAKGSVIMSNVAPKGRDCETLEFKEYKVINHNTPVKAVSMSKKSIKVHRKGKAAWNRYIMLTKRSLRSDRTLQQYMSEYTYRNKILSKLKTHGQRYCQFLEDIKKVFPGPSAIGMTLKSIGISVETVIQEPYFDIEIKGHEETIKEGIFQIEEPQVA